MSEATLIFWGKAAKAGKTWLYSRLDAHPETASPRRICSVLRASYAPAAVGLKVQRDAKITLDKDRRGRAHRVLARQYDFIRATLGDLPPRWTDNMAKV